MVTATALGPNYMKLLATPIEYWANESLLFFINVKIAKNVCSMISLAAKSRLFISVLGTAKGNSEDVT